MLFPAQVPNCSEPAFWEVCCWRGPALSESFIPEQLKTIGCGCRSHYRTCQAAWFFRYRRLPDDRWRILFLRRFQSLFVFCLFYLVLSFSMTRSLLLSLFSVIRFSSISSSFGALGIVVGWSFTVQARRSRVRFTMSFAFSIYLIFPAALCPCVRFSL
jgi:hypothetical protein